jgi:hypothetical protein
MSNMFLLLNCIFEVLSHKKGTNLQNASHIDYGYPQITPLQQTNIHNSGIQQYITLMMVPFIKNLPQTILRKIVGIKGKL